ncbi:MULTISPECIES: Lrp/AsnC ligand binding domain-containing protein [Streptomyces]|uniref:Lrp/AsnC ligand binding domain-containing protein n=1 Tax=Streptomyces TaxID=1883 RepID=UPI001E4A28F8|nr:Lrp/AsnC ligand binding domain-containing protein [Streptomyces chartreusis]
MSSGLDPGDSCALGRWSAVTVLALGHRQLEFCIEAVVQTALSGEDLVAEDREELREASALLLGDILIVGQLLISSGCCRVATSRPPGGHGRDPRFHRSRRPPGAGLAHEAFVEVHCARNPIPAQLRQALEDVPEVVEACTVSGAADAVLHMLARDITHLELAIQRGSRHRSRRQDRERHRALPAAQPALRCDYWRFGGLSRPGWGTRQSRRGPWGHRGRPALSRSGRFLPPAI